MPLGLVSDVIAEAGTDKETGHDQVSAEALQASPLAWRNKLRAAIEKRNSTCALLVS